ncbi:MAG: hypothetical protein JOY54_06355 [Acidobacteriaceae bacterium]|nr:hypothetical protein [Acidobacteriaceae bacterium]
MKLPFRVTPKVRIAEISAIPTVEMARGFSYEQWTELPLYRPSVLAGTTSELKLLVEEIERKKLDLSCVDRGITVLTYSCSPLLDDIFRVLLWQTFGVPVYELLVGPNRTLIAAECEAHEGWHVRPSADVSFVDGELMCTFRSCPPVQTGWLGRLEIEPCACGRGSARLMDLVFPMQQTRRKLAATA